MAGYGGGINSDVLDGKQNVWLFPAKEPCNTECFSQRSQKIPHSQLIYIYMHKYTYTYIYMYINIYTYVHIYIYIYLYTYILEYIYTYICTRQFIRTVCFHIYICTYTYIYVYLFGMPSLSYH